ncbi:MAG: hypothetical protein M0P31_07050 [Solirubrobacteraceae bacterium]|nr:hypothetical protein [Solirubrobacteraceae bacterium]
MRSTHSRTAPSATHRARHAVARPLLAAAVALAMVPATASAASVDVKAPKNLGTERELTFTFTGTSADPAPDSEPGWRSWLLTSVAYRGTKACPASSRAYLEATGAVLVGNQVVAAEGPFNVKQTEVTFSTPGTYRLCTYLAAPGGGASDIPEQVFSRTLKVPDTSFVPHGKGRKPTAGAWRATKWSPRSGASSRSKATFTVRGNRVGDVVGKVISVFCPNGSLGTIQNWPAATVKKFATVKRGRVKSQYRHKGGTVTFEGVFVTATRFRGSIHVSTITGCNGGLVFEARRR